MVLDGADSLYQRDTHTHLYIVFTHTYTHTHTHKDIFHWSEGEAEFQERAAERVGSGETGCPYALWKKVLSPLEQSDHQFRFWVLASMRQPADWRVFNKHINQKNDHLRNTTVLAKSL